MLAISNLPPTKINIEATLHQLMPHGMSDAIRIQKRKDTMVLRYEDFYNNFDLLFDLLESFFDKSLESSAKERFRMNFGIAEIRRRSESLGDFENFDPEDQIHGRHISEHGGEPGMHEKILDIQSIDLINKFFKLFCERFNYL